MFSDLMTAFNYRMTATDILGWQREELLALALLVTVFAGVLCLFNRRR